MVKSIRIKTHKYHEELLKIQGELQAKDGSKVKSMDDVILHLLKKAGRKV